MAKITIFLLFFNFLVSPSFANETYDTFSGVLKSRKVIGVIYFKKNNFKLSESQQAEINRISSMIDLQSSPDSIVRVEGFAEKKGQTAKQLNDSLSRAKLVWYYLRKMDVISRDNLYLTGFSASQSISELEGERVEIAIYENLFNIKERITAATVERITVD